MFFLLMFGIMTSLPGSRTIH